MTRGGPCSTLTSSSLLYGSSSRPKGVCAAARRSTLYCRHDNPSKVVGPLSGLGSKAFIGRKFTGEISCSGKNPFQGGFLMREETLSGIILLGKCPVGKNFSSRRIPLEI